MARAATLHYSLDTFSLFIDAHQRAQCITRPR
jgi:hypothetical protein